jgi:hypothetical protein
MAFNRGTTKLAASCCCLVVLAGCAHGPTAAPSARPVTSAPPRSDAASTATSGEQSRVIAAYRNMWGTYVAAARTSDYRSPQLARYSTGSAHSLLVRGLRDARKSGIVTLGSPGLNPRIVSLTPTGRPAQAVVRDCADSSHWLAYDRAGRVVGGRSPGRRSIEAVLRQSGGAWKVADLVVEKEGTC